MVRFVRVYWVDITHDLGFSYDLAQSHHIYNFTGISSIVDSDGDVVAFSTDEELMEALGYVSDGIFKVYITTKGKSSLF